MGIKDSFRSEHLDISSGVTRRGWLSPRQESLDSRPGQRQGRAIPWELLSAVKTLFYFLFCSVTWSPEALKIWTSMSKVSGLLDSGAFTNGTSCWGSGVIPRLLHGPVHLRTCNTSCGSQETYLAFSRSYLPSRPGSLGARWVLFSVEPIHVHTKGLCPR